MVAKVVTLVAAVVAAMARKNTDSRAPNDNSDKYSMLSNIGLGI